MKSNNWFLILIISMTIGMCHLQADANPLDDHGDTWKVATDIFFDAPQPGQVNLPGDIDYFRLEITEPGELTVYTTGSLDTIGSIEDDTGIAFIEGDQEGEGNNFSIVCNAKPETYYIRVRGYENATGDYTLHTSFVPDPEAPLVPDAETPVDTPEIADDHGDTWKVATELFFDIPQTGQINPVEDIDYFRLEIPEPGELTVYTTGALDTIGSIEDNAGVFANGDQEGEGNNFSIVYYAKPETYYIRVRGYENATGDYTLHASFVPGAEPPPVQLQNIVPDPENHTRATATRITLNSSRDGTISPVGDVDWWRVEIPVGNRDSRIIFETTGNTDTFGRLEGSSFIADDDDSGVGTNFRIVLQVTRGGTFYIRVTEFGNNARGSYTLHVHSDVNYTRATADPLSLGSPLNLRINYVGDVDYFRLQVPSAGELTVYTTGGTDTIGRLESSSGSTLASNDDGGASTNFRIVRNVTSGTYYVRVSGWRSSTTGNGRTGPYTLYANFSTRSSPPPTTDDHGNTRATATSLPLNSPLTGVISPAYDVDYFRVRVTASGPLTVYTTGNTDTYGYLEDSSGAVLARDDDSGVSSNFRIVHNVTPGTYYIRVRGFSSRTGSYTLQANMGSADDHGNTRATATSLPLNSPLTGRISPAGDIDYFRVRVTASGELTVYTTGSTDTVGRLESSNGSTLASNDDGGVDRNFRIVRDVTAGTYYIRVTGFGSRTGSYTLQANMGSTNVDVNGDGVVDIGDLIIAVTHFGTRNVTFEQGDVNGDNVVDRADFLAILDVLDGGGATAPSVHQKKQSLPVESLRRWIDQAKQLNNTDVNFQKGIAVLEQLLARLIETETIPTATAVLPNYPNPFNPETWIPYQLAKPADVTVTIYDINGRVVRYLNVGHQRAGLYHSRSRAAHWDGRNAQGESVASGVYFYTLTAGDFTATRKLLIAK